MDRQCRLEQISNSGKSPFRDCFREFRFCVRRHRFGGGGKGGFLRGSRCGYVRDGGIVAGLLMEHTEKIHLPVCDPIHSKKPDR